MKNPRAKKPFATLAKDLREIRRRPLTQEQINNLNRIFIEIEKKQKSDISEEEPKKKIARSPEVET
jgi:hypothetical protein